MGLVSAPPAHAVDDDLRLPPRVVWHNETGHPTLGSWRAALDSTLLVAPGSREVFGLTPGDGSASWRQGLPTAPRVAALVDDGNGGRQLLVGGVVGVAAGGDQLHDLHALSPATGRILWSLAAGGVFAPPVSDGERTIVASTHALLAVDSRSGAATWRIDFPRDPDGHPGGPMQAGPLVSQGVVVVGAGDRRLYAFDGATGTYRWHRDVACRPYGAAAAHESNIICAVGDTLFSLRLLDGTASWALPLGGQPAVATPVIDGEVIYLATGTGRGVVAIDADSGNLRWQTDLGELTFGQPALTRTMLWVADASGRLSALDRGDGQLLWQRQLAETYLSAPVIDGGRLVVGAASGDLFLFDSPPEPLPAPAPSAPPRLLLAPNPARSAVHITASGGELAIFDVQGRRVATHRLEENAADAGLVWSGVDAAGNRLPAGVYFVRHTTPGGAETAKLHLLR